MYVNKIACLCSRPCHAPLISPYTHNSHVSMMVSMGPTGMSSSGSGAPYPRPAPARGNSFLYHLSSSAVNRALGSLGSDEGLRS